MKTGLRRRGRENALQILYYLDKEAFEHIDADLGIELFFENFKNRQKEQAFTKKLVEGVLSNLRNIDELITKTKTKWRLSRMAIIDRNLLRISVFELNYCEDVPNSVAISEAIERGGKFGTQSTAPFVNGILDQISKDLKKAKTT